jgi:hypothetical protein
MAVLGGIHYFRTSGGSGAGVMRAVAQQLVLAWAVILLILNCRLDVWMAARRGVSLLEMHNLFSPMIIPGLTLALVLWFGIVMAVTKPKRSV